jgi:hypothetical protein
VQKLRLAAANTPFTTTSAREMVVDGAQADLPRFINGEYPEIHGAYQGILNQDSELGKQLSSGQALFVVVVCRGEMKNYLKCIILKSGETGVKAMQLFHSPVATSHRDTKVHMNIEAVRRTKFMFVEPTIEREGKVPCASKSDHANMIRLQAAFTGDDDLCVLTSGRSNERVDKLDHACFAYLFV